MTTRPREAELYRAATRLFRERGFHATSMQDIAEALGMNRGSLYHYITSKDDLLWTARYLMGEAGDDVERTAVLWTMVNRFAFYRALGSGWRSDPARSATRRVRGAAWHSCVRPGWPQVGWPR